MLESLERQLQLPPNTDDRFQEKTPIDRGTQKNILRVLRLFEFLTYYLIIGTIYCWLTILINSLQNIYTEILFYPVRMFPNSSRLFLFLVSLTLKRYTLANITAICFFGEYVWMNKNKVECCWVWEISVFLFSMSIIFGLFRIAVFFVREWFRKNGEILRSIEMRERRIKVELEEFIKMAESGMIP